MNISISKKWTARLLSLKMPKAILLLIALIAAAFIILPLKNILLGLYNWHIRQPETIHGVIELAVLFLVELIFIIKLKKASVIMNIIIIMHKLLELIIEMIILTLEVMDKASQKKNDDNKKD